MNETPGSNADGAIDYSPEPQPQPLSFLEARVAFAPRPGFLTWLGPSRNDFRLVGTGSIAVHGPSVEVKGRRFGFILGLPLRRRVELNTDDLFNVELEENVVRFERRTADDKSKSLTFWLADTTVASNLFQLLPADKTPDFVPQLAAHLDFEEQLEIRAPHPPVTYGFAALCLVMFAVTISHGASWFKASGLVESAWGSNFGPLTIGGEWWRLLTYSLLHFGVIHLAFNLWALVSFGVIAERLYGSLRYAIICVVAGAAGGMMSIVMQPTINSAGASAVIFGIFGALLVARLRGAEAIPPSVQRSLQNSTLFFAVVALVGGFIFPGIDNAAHIGGLVAGTCMGLAFQSPRRGVRLVAPAMLAVLIILTGVGLAHRAGARTTSEAAYWEGVRWFWSGETGAVEKWIELWRLARAQNIGDDALADRLEKELLPFWREASERFKPLEFEIGTEMFDLNQYMKLLSNGRLHAIELCVSGLRAHDTQIVTGCMKEMGQVDEMIRERLKAIESKK